MTDLIVLRASPDWLRFDLAETRPFLRGIGYPEDMLEQFVAIWDASFALDYRSYRHRLKTLALDTAAAAGCAVATRDALDGASPYDRIVFLDDDDWLAPDLFARLPDVAGAEGYRWGSVRIGLDYDPTAPGAALVQIRPLSAVVYTNNYAVTGRMLARHGAPALFEHTAADPIFAAHPGAIADSAHYLSCAVKHPCSTTAAFRLMADPGFRGDPTATIRTFQERLETAQLPHEADWLATPLDHLRAIMRDIRPA